MVRKIWNIYLEVISDLVSCKNRAQMLLQSSPVDKRILAIGLIIVFIFALSINPNPNDILFYFLKIIFVSVITFIIFTLSDAFWFIQKKAWIYRLHIKRRQNIHSYLKNIDKIKLEESELKHPEGAIIIISHYNSEGYKPHSKRVGVEIAIFLGILMFSFPLFFIFNIALFCMMFFYEIFYEQQSTDQVFRDMSILVRCVYNLYEENPENCRKFIMESKIPYVLELQTIYRAIKISTAAPKP